ncbi:M48 family metallopeptidase [Thermosediminibacter litoriperuensis]|uniref:Zn-dependent protease with chaperone function n=1 Tax=Thermosediminibacter litoriperuensis TaxID=291989 RepID=A0A5S5APX9_9FIRM|nr:M48 family metallopeptidase [Thermosediminibacter litoriperuensis]TYP52403.1 Zn-dependent protease with chaperone function [Thermosediminibacter litoriperuensis]
MINVSALRHEKERVYLAICMIVGGLVWLALIWVAWALLILVALVSWGVGQYFKAFIYGNAVRVSQEQFREIDQIVKELARELNLFRVPDVFVLSGQGAPNALAIRFLTGRYILLSGEVVDLSLKRDAYAELRMIIGHELAHHALGHISIWRNFLLLPARIIPFLGAAYSRACELSADRVGMVLARDCKAARRALLALTVGSEALAAKLDPQAFIEQEKYVPPIMGFIYELFASHPRMTVRIIQLKKYEEQSLLLRRTPAATLLEEAARESERSVQEAVEYIREIAVAGQTPCCSSCGQQVLLGNRFCPNCGQKL